jgi:hypothetical protein
MATLKKKAGPTSEPQLYIVRMPGGYGGVQADEGQIVKLIAGAKQDQLLRLRYLEPWDGKEKYECGPCGAKFESERYRMAHGNQRHSDKAPKFIDLNDCSPEEKARIKHDAGAPNLTRRDPEYWVNHHEFNVPDPIDKEAQVVERAARENINWEKTAAANK